MREKVIECRNSKDLSQNELSIMLGCSQQVLSLIENGKRKPTLMIAKKMETFFEIDMTELFPDIFLPLHTTKCDVT